MFLYVEAGLYSKLDWNNESDVELEGFKEKANPAGNKVNEESGVEEDK